MTEPDYRHIVKGHWRKQWYPSESTHKLVWVDQHEKGDLASPLVIKDTDLCSLPADKPLLPEGNFIVDGHWHIDGNGQQVWVEPSVMNCEEYAREVHEFMQSLQDDPDQDESD